MRFFTLFKYICLTLFVSAVSSAQAAGADAGAGALTRPRYFPPAARSLTPSVTSGNVAVVNAASFLPGVSPGALITIFGDNLSDVSGIVVANTNPLPYELAHVSVSINGISAPLFSVAYNGAEDQISVQVPYAIATGPGAALVEVFDYGFSVGTARTDSFDEDPGIFMYQGTNAVALLYPDYSLLGPNNAALPGDYIILYATGLGPLSLNLRDGYGAPSDPLADTQDPFQVLIAGEACRVFFSGLAPGFVGLYQLNIQLPLDLPRGTLDVQITSPFANSNVAALRVN
jgi:minor extracellular serine protease Vpr